MKKAKAILFNECKKVLENCNEMGAQDNSGCVGTFN
jgi:hypothetical protein